MSSISNTNIPYDVYESDNEIVVVLPLWGVNKESLNILLNKNILKIKWKREKPKLKDNLVPQKEDCYWWEFNTEIQLPLTVYFDKIKVVLTKENILIITIPKYQLPEDIKLTIEII